MNNRRTAWNPVDNLDFIGSSRDLSNITNVNPGGAMSAIDDIHISKIDTQVNLKQH